MGFPCRRHLLSWVVLAGVLVAGPAAAATPGEVRAERASADLVLVREGDVVGEDLYAAGNRVRIEGVIEGDLVASATRSTEVPGRVQGDVTVVARSVVVTGRVEGAVRVVAGSLLIDGEVDGDVWFGGGTLVLADGARVGGDVAGWAAVWDTTGEVGRNVLGRSIDARLGGEIGGDVELDAWRLRVIDGTMVAGGLTYRASREAQIDQGATVTGSVTRRQSLLPNVRFRSLLVLTWILAAIGFIVAGLLSLVAVPGIAQQAVRAAGSSPLRSAAVGVLALLLPSAVLLLLTAPAAGPAPDLVLPLLAVGLPFFLGILGVVALAAALGAVPVVTAVGRRILRRRSAFAGFLLGTVLLIGLLVVPLVRWVALPVVVLIGLGAWIIGAWRSRGDSSWTLPAQPGRHRSEGAEPPSEQVGDASLDDDHRLQAEAGEDAGPDAGPVT